MSQPFIGQIEMFGGNFAPRDWAFCDGALLQIASFTALFSILGTTYGGDGRTTFGLPDLRGRMPIHEGQGPGLPNYRLGQKGGQPTKVLTSVQMSSHAHAHSAAMKATASNAGTPNPTGTTLGIPTAVLYHDTDGPSVDMSDASAGGETASTGGGQSFNKMPPYLALNYIIALQGIFPSRN
jgi:microcystin-dependent protein